MQIIETDLGLSVVRSQGQCLLVSVTLNDRTVDAQVCCGTTRCSSMEKSHAFSSESSLVRRLGEYSCEYKAKDKTPGARDPQNFCKRELSFVFPEALFKRFYLFLSHAWLGTEYMRCLWRSDEDTRYTRKL